MKIVRLVLALYILLMTLYPCQDEDACNEEKVSMASVQGAQEEAEQELCSPFCNCTCCSAHVQITSLPAVPTIDFTHSTRLVPYYPERPFFKDGHSIWQPPRA